MRKAIAIAATKDTQNIRVLGQSFVMAAVLLSLLNLLVVGVSVVRPMIPEW
ncbi:MAG: hypothetical protein AAGC58_11645 [Asticcacaulis sp.]|uniref:hypothetical protein n=1 Tax=Asticcacaulis tiandongensis TaxID=2565365 RepID=UPI0015E83C93|nr:hypothetical protein [Asticcacaulis tiandongensis]